METTRTASEELKLKNGVPVDAEVNKPATQTGPEDGRDQNISPNPHSYEPDNGKSNKATDHNKEVHRTGEAISKYPSN